MKEIKFILTVIVLISIPHLASSQINNGQDLAQKNFLLFIGQDKESILDYLNHVEQNPDGFMGYTSLKHLEGLTEPKDSGAGIQQMDYFLTNFPKAKLQIGLYLVDALDGIIAGDYDQQIDKLARWLKNAKRYAGV